MQQVRKPKAPAAVVMPSIILRRPRATLMSVASITKFEEDQLSLDRSIDLRTYRGQ